VVDDLDAHEIAARRTVSRSSSGLGRGSPDG
jgi:hypothetical protein